MKTKTAQQLINELVGINESPVTNIGDASHYIQQAKDSYDKFFKKDLKAFDASPQEHEIVVDTKRKLDQCFQNILSLYKKMDARK